MLTKYYLISNSTNDMWYTDNHETAMYSRWTRNYEEAHKYLTYDEAYTELDTDVFPCTEFKITEVIVKLEDLI